MSQTRLNLVGLEIKVTTSLNQEYTGRIYAFVEDCNMLVLCNTQAGKGNSESRDFIFINTKYLMNVTVLQNEAQPIDLNIPYIDIKQIIAEADRKIAAESSKRQSLNSQASEEGQELFREISKTYGCDWDGQNIFLRDLRVTIKPPYKRSEDIVGNTSAIQRIERVVSFM